MLALRLGRRDLEPDDEGQVRVPQREAAPADPGDPAAEHVELLAGNGLGGVGEEGEVDVRHGRDGTPNGGLSEPVSTPSPACATAWPGPAP